MNKERKKKSSWMIHESDKVMTEKIKLLFNDKDIHAQHPRYERSTESYNLRHQMLSLFFQHLT
jgi:hypothetical protein